MSATDVKAVMTGWGTAQERSLGAVSVAVAVTSLAASPSGTTDEHPVIFIVDDDPSMRATLADVMRSVGLAVQTFASAQDFLGSKLPDAPACLVLDVRLPGQSGLDLHRTLAESGIELPVVFISGNGDVQISVQAMKAGLFDGEGYIGLAKQGEGRRVRLRR